jgi:hypothetical protein
MNQFIKSPSANRVTHKSIGLQVICYLVMLLFLNCVEKPKSNSESLSIVESKLPLTLFELVPIADPLEFKDFKQDSLNSLFANHAVWLESNGLTLQGTANIVNHLMASTLRIDSVARSYVTVANSDSTYRYEVGTYWTQDNAAHKYLMILKMSEPFPMIELLFTSPSSPSTADTALLNTRRHQWMALCNRHQVKPLVDQLYTEQAIYFNHKPLVIGRTDIIKEYEYMNNKKYYIFLKPIHIESINDRLIFEIGQGGGSFQGKYILIWYKTDDGTWKVMMDSNI